MANRASIQFYFSMDKLQFECLYDLLYKDRLMHLKVLTLK